MEITGTSSTSEFLDRRFARLGGIVSIVLGLVVLACGCILLLQSSAAPAELVPASAAPLTGAGLLLWAVVLLAGGGYLLRGRTWAQVVLLILFAINLAGSVVAATEMVLKSVTAYQAWIAAVLGLVISAGMVYVLFCAAAPKTRLRYGSNVVVSIVLAIAVLILANQVAQSDFLRRDLESLGRYGISPRTQSILEAVDQPIRLTCVYTSTDEKRKGSEYRGQVTDLLEEMQARMVRLHKDMEVINVTSDSEKAKLLVRLRTQLGGQATAHVALLKSFDARSEQLLKDLRGELQVWGRLPEESYLKQWGLAPEIQRFLTDLVQQIDDLRMKVSRELMASGLTDYAKLVDEVKEATENTKEPIDKISELLARMSQIPGAVAKNRAGATEAAKRAEDSLKALAQALGGEAATAPTTTAPASAPASAPAAAPANPAKALQDYIAAASAAEDQILTAAAALENVAGPDNAELVKASSNWVYGRYELGPLYRRLVQAVNGSRLNVQTYLSKATPEAQVELIQKLRPEIAQFRQLLSETDKAALDAIDKLAKVDEDAKKIFARAEGGKFFESIQKPLIAMLDDIKKLPQLKSESLATDVAQENIVVIEVGGKAKVVPFDEVWPLRVRPQGMGSNEQEEKRIFNGDSAIASKILGMTQKPFATVLMTYMQVPPQMAQMMRGSAISPQILTSLRKRLEEANFEVAEWDLAQEMPAASDKARPQVLLVLPPPPPMPPMGQGAPPMPGFGPEQAAKIRRAVDSGVPAIFLAKYLPPISMGFFPMPQPYKLNEYLGEDWGLEAQTDSRLIPGIPDQTVPGRFKVDVLGFSFLPLSTFNNDNPIGKPLQAQRYLWNDICPVKKVKAHEGVTVKPLLSVPADRTGLWATKQVEELIYKIRVQPEGFVAPTAEDLRPPFDVAVSATREGDPRKGVKPSRIVLLGIGGSFFDGYMDQQVPVLGSKGEISFADAPLANADVVVNSVYWLSANDKYIAAGPVLVKPVNVETGTRNVLWVLCVIVLPLAVVGVGLVVMVLRQR